MNKNSLLIMRNFSAKVLAMVSSLPTESLRRNSKPTQAGMSLRLLALVLRSWWVGCWCFLFSFYIHLNLEWQNLCHLLHVCLASLSRSKMFTLNTWEVSCYWTWNIVIQNEPIFVLVEAEGVGFVFSWGLFGGLRPVLSVSLLLVWSCSSFPPWPPSSSLLKKLKGDQQHLVIMDNFCQLSDPTHTQMSCRVSTWSKITTWCLYIFFLVFLNPSVRGAALSAHRLTN